MECLALAARFPHPDPESIAQNLIDDVLDALERMVGRGHLPSQALLVRLTDGRVRVHAPLEGRSEAEEHLGRLRNEYGPADIALWISVEPAGPQIQLAVQNLMAPWGVRSQRAASRLVSTHGEPTPGPGQTSSIPWARGLGGSPSYPRPVR